MAAVAATGPNIGSNDDRELRLVPTLINALVAGLSDPNRLSRGRTYARQGAVQDLEVDAGVVRGSVQGSRARPYEVTVRVAPADSFDSLIALVPTDRDLTFLCSCPDWDDPCKHAVAVMIAFADLVGDDPETLREWRGKLPGDTTAPAIIGSRTREAPVPSGAAPSGALDPAVVAALRDFLGTPADYTLAEVSRLAPPNAQWAELWAEMLADALSKLTDS